MKKLLCFAVFISSIIGFAEDVSTIYSQNWEKGKGDFSTGKIIFSEDRKSNVLLHKGGAGWFWIKDFKPNVKYKLTFYAKFDGENTFENNPLTKKIFHDVNKKQKGITLPGWRISFCDDKKTWKNDRILFCYYRIFYSSKWTKYEQVFYPAPGATMGKVIFDNPGKENLYIDDIKVETITESALNINPDFKYGKYNHSGYSMAGYGSSVRMKKRAGKDKYDMSVPTWIGTDPMPVTPGKNYVIQAKLAPDATKGSRFGITFFEIDNKTIKDGNQRTVLVKKATQEGKANFIAPAKASFMKMLIHGGKGVKFESIKVTEEPLEADK